MISSVIDCFTKIDKYGLLNVYHPPNILLHNREPGFWVVHDEIESLLKQAIIDIAKFVANDLKLDKIAGIGAAIAAKLAAVIAVMGIGSIISNILVGGSGGSNNVALDFNTKINYVNNNIKNLSSIKYWKIII
jgi:hypothetical protein